MTGSVAVGGVGVGWFSFQTQTHLRDPFLGISLNLFFDKRQFTGNL